ncbi:MAG: RNA-binding S4 domain-containing protein [Pseudomonadota bacterium]
MRNVSINRQPVELYKILKFEGLCESGGEAKAAVEQGLVKVNGEVETRKRKQIVVGDTIEFSGEQFGIVLDEAAGADKAAAAAAKSAAVKKPAFKPTIAKTFAGKGPAAKPNAGKNYGPKGHAGKGPAPRKPRGRVNSEG